MARMNYYLVQNKYNKNKRVIHEEGCCYLKSTKESSLYNLGDHDMMRAAIIEIENRNFEIIFCARCCKQKKRAQREVYILKY